MILEIGVSQGGSLEMWKNYFGNKATIYGIDINPKCLEMEKEGFNIFIGSQSDRKFLKEVKMHIPPIDILIDDGGHTMVQQITSFEELFDCIKDDGIYLCEDLHTSYWASFGGGHKRRGSFIEYSKNFIDYLNANHSNQMTLKQNKFTNAVDSIHYYDSMLIIEKKKRKKPHNVESGKSVESFTPEGGHVPRNYFKLLINYVLRIFRLRSV